MSRNFVATLQERQADDQEQACWFIQIELHERIVGIVGDTIAIDLAPGTSERQARAVINGMNQLGARLQVSR